MEERINKQIIDLLNSANGNAMKEDVFKLSFTFKGKPYETIFKASHSKTGYGLDNRCVTIWYEEHNPGTAKLFDTSIRANAIELDPCFTPQLVSYRKGNNNNQLKITSADVLQTLKTKLSLLLFDAEREAAAEEGGAAAGAAANSPRVELSDIAMKDGIYISKFNFLRGKPAFYEKYGYVSQRLNELKELYKTLTYSEFFSEIYMVGSPKQSWLTIIDLIPDYTEGLVGDELFSTIMKQITWVMEKHNIEERESISTDLFDILSVYLLRKVGKTFDNNLLFRFTLDRDSPAWQKYNGLLVFTEFTFPLKGLPPKGGRRTKKRLARPRKRRTVRNTLINRKDNVVVSTFITS